MKRESILGKKIKVSKLLSYGITLVVLLLLILSGPASAFTLNLVSDKTTLNIGELVSFTASLEIDSDERLPVDYLYLEIIPAGINCRFLADGTSVSGCDGINIDLLSSSDYTNGNQTGEYNGTDYNWGYGYGYSSGLSSILSYNITWNTTGVASGTYSTKLNAKIKTDVFTKQGNNLTILAPLGPFNLIVYSPENKFYSEKGVLFNIVVSSLSNISYFNFNDGSGSFKTLCNNCLEYGNSSRKSILLKEGENNLTIRAVNSLGQSAEKNISLFIDSKNPKIYSISAVGSSSRNNISLSVGYYEDNLRNITLFYWNKTGIVNQITKYDCLSGDKRNCSFYPNLSIYAGQTLEYWFVVKDVINSESSKKGSFKVDIVPPVINSFSYTNLGKNKVNVRINITEENFNEISYIDRNARPSKQEKLLCKPLRKGICEKKISYAGNSPNMIFIAKDNIGNFANAEIP